jgi:hypothetical protein
MNHQLTFITCKGETHLRRLVEQLLRRIELQLSAADRSEAAFLHGTGEKHPERERNRVRLVLSLPGRTLVAKEEELEPVHAIREAVEDRNGRWPAAGRTSVTHGSGLALLGERLSNESG